MATREGAGEVGGLGTLGAEIFAERGAAALVEARELGGEACGANLECGRALRRAARAARLRAARRACSGRRVTACSDRLEQRAQRVACEDVQLADPLLRRVECVPRVLGAAGAAFARVDHRLRAIGGVKFAACGAAHRARGCGRTSTLAAPSLNCTRTASASS